MSSPLTRTLLTRDGRAAVVHRLSERDIAALQRFNAALSERTRSVFLPHAYDEATLMRCVERDARGADRAYLLCAGEEVVGYFFLWEFDQPVPVLGVGLADAWQGTGLGEQILQRLIEDARAAKREAVELTTVPGNVRAFRLYQRLGFSHIGDVENVAGDGRVVREHRMFLPLKPGGQPPARDFRPPGA